MIQYGYSGILLLLTGPIPFIYQRENRKTRLLSEGFSKKIEYLYIHRLKYNPLF
jgi:hypothetical protein